MAEVERMHDAARRELELVEAELAVVKQELVLQHLVATGEPTEEARMALARLRDVVARQSASASRTDGEGTVEVAGEVGGDVAGGLPERRPEPAATSFREECAPGR